LRSRFLLLAIVGSVLAVAGVAVAQLSPSEVVASRVGGYRETGTAFKSLNDQLKAGTPVKFVMRRAAKTIAKTARDQYNWFPAGSGPAAGLKTKAKAKVWSDAALFKEAQTRFQREADLLVIAVETDDIGQIKKRARAVGETCASCHQKFREK
jgi:cytochrome c556